MPGLLPSCARLFATVHHLAIVGQSEQRNFDAAFASDVWPLVFRSLFVAKNEVAQGFIGAAPALARLLFFAVRRVRRFCLLGLSSYFARDLFLRREHLIFAVILSS